VVASLPPVGFLDGGRRHDGQETTAELEISQPVASFIVYAQHHTTEVSSSRHKSTLQTGRLRAITLDDSLTPKEAPFVLGCCCVAGTR